MLSRNEHGLRELCRSAIKLNEDILFVGIVDRSGKLLVGEGSNYSIPTRICPHCQNSALYDFYLFWLVDLVQNTNCDASCPQPCGKVHFSLSRFRGTSLTVAPLSQEKDLCLCIHMQTSSIEKELNIMYTTVGSVSYYRTPSYPQ
jgi:hypothetical protein